ncbi:MAG: glycosyltransferase [Bryobacteraceae bacterium]
MSPEEAAVVCFWTGDPRLAAEMTARVFRATSGHPHYVVSTYDAGFPGARTIRLRPGSAWSLYRQLGEALAGVRVGLAPVLFTSQPDPLRLAALLLAPRRILAFNASLDRRPLSLAHPLEIRRLFAARDEGGVRQRPAWLRDTPQDSPDFPDATVLHAGRALRRGRPRIGIVTPYFPYPLSHGGAVRIFNLLRETAREFDVFLFSFDDLGHPPELAPVLEHSAMVAIVRPQPGRAPRWAPWLPAEWREVDSAAMRALISRIRAQQRLDLVQIEYTHMAGYEGDILVEHDVTFHLYRQVAGRSPGVGNAFEYRRWRWNERRAARRFRRVVFMSGEESAMLDCGGRGRVVPNGVDLDRFVPAPESPGKRLLFVGSFGHFPNVWAYRHFTERILPMIRSRHPDASLTVVGGRDHEMYWRMFANSPAPPLRDGITLLGFVADVRPLYNDANIVVVPNTVSAGTNVKALEAMAMRRAVVSTPCGCAGLGLRHGESAWIAESAADFAEGVSSLLDDDGLRLRLSSRARAVADCGFGWTAIGESMRAVYRELLERGP